MEGSEYGALASGVKIISLIATNTHDIPVRYRGPRSLLTGHRPGPMEQSGAPQQGGRQSVLSLGI